MAKKLDLDFFETIILYQCLAGNSEYVATVAEYLDPKYFRDGNVRPIIEIISEYYEEYDVPPNASEVKARLHDAELRESFKKAVTRFKELSPDYNPKELLGNTEEFLKQRMVIEVLRQATKSHDNGDPIDVDAAFDSLEEANSIALLDDLGMDYFNDIDAHVERLNEEVRHLSTGWEWLDEKLGGGWMDDGRALYIFSGVTNVGKSIFLGNIAVNAIKQGKTAIIISLEMSEHVYASRIDAQLSQIAMNDLSSKSEDLRSFVKQYKEDQCDSQLFIKEFPPSTVSARHISAYLKKLVRRGVTPDIIIIDYLSLLEPIKSFGSTYVDVKKIAEQVRALSYIYECPVVSATQLNRDAFGQEDPGLETTSESMGLSHTVDAQLSIWCNEEDSELGIINLGLMKNRFGPKFGQCQLNIDYNTLTLYEGEKVRETNDIETLLGEGASLVGERGGMAEMLS